MIRKFFFSPKCADRDFFIIYMYPSIISKVCLKVLNDCLNLLMIVDDDKRECMKDE